MAGLQINLLPDVKLQYIKQQRSRNMVISAATLASLVALAIFLVLMLMVNVVQKRQLDSADKSIAAAQGQLQSIPGLDRIVTVQNQLDTLSELHSQKHVTSRIFNILSQVTPTEVFVGRLSIDTKTTTIQLDGTASSQRAVNVFVDTLKFTTFKMGSASESKSAFPSVVLSSFGVTAGRSNYSLHITYDAELFSTGQLNNRGKLIKPTLKVPNQTTTRSVIKDDNSVFGRAGSN